VGGAVGSEQPKPGGGTYFLDPHQSGTASRLRIRELQWGRLVDVHDVDADEVPGVEPVFRNMVVNENRISDGFNYALETNPATQQARLVILRTRGAPDDGSGTFEDLLDAAVRDLSGILPKNDDGTAAQPFSLIARNATLVVAFDDLLDDDADAVGHLNDSLQLLTGYPPVVPTTLRILFDPNHGGVVDGAFHSTRLLLDMTVSEAEASAMATPLPLNALGLPPSQPNTGQANISLRIPTRIDAAAGQFFLLRGLSGGPLSTGDNGPMDSSSPTQDVVRAMRSGNNQDTNNGFLLDPVQPRVIADWQVTVLTAVDAGGGSAPGTRFLIDMRFETPCRAAPRSGDIVLAGGDFLEVAQAGVAPDAGGVVSDVLLRVISGEPVQNANAILGVASFLTPYVPGTLVPTGCWVTLIPDARMPPSTDVTTRVQVLARFSEAMDPSSMKPFDTFRMIRGVKGTSDLPRNIVIGDINDSIDLTEFTFVPLLPLAASNGPNYVIQLLGGNEGVTDLAGNRLRDGIPEIEIALDPGEPDERNGGLAMRFLSPDDLAPIGLPDIRGQALFDTDRGILLPRGVLFSSIAADRSVPIVSVMTPFPPGLQTPLTPLGSKMQGLWRYADVGWQVRDETKYNMDVVGMNWSPVGGQVISDFYDEFEIRLAHCRKLPDEEFPGTGPSYPRSGIGKSGSAQCTTGPPGIAYSDNVLGGVGGGQAIVHPRQLGYRIDPSDLFVNPNGTFLMPFPFNRGGGDLVSYTWRDTAALGKDGIGGAGIPMDIEVGPPLFLEQGVGSVAGPGLIPSIGLPLLWEIRCYPSDSGLGLNSLDVSIPINTFCEPTFRAYSTGGFDTSGTAIFKDPDLELFPSGAFNPSSNPPGQVTPLNTDSIFYIGQLDVVIRVSRSHTAWLDTALASPTFFAPILEPRPDDQPLGTRIVLEYRGALAFAPGTGTDPFNAQALDAYGDLGGGLVSFLDDDADWTDDIRDLDGARYIQIRLSFFNNIQSGQNAELDSLGLSWSE